MTMADWYCFRDKKEMEKSELTLSYMGLSQRVPGLKCPICGVEYLMENVVMTSVKAAESALEAK